MTLLPAFSFDYSYDCNTSKSYPLAAILNRPTLITFRRRTPDSLDVGYGHGGTLHSSYTGDHHQRLCYILVKKKVWKPWDDWVVESGYHIMGVGSR